jgi:hypothetical protein
VIVGAVLGAAGAVACRDVLGLGGIQEEPCVGTCDGGGNDASVDTGNGGDADAEACAPILVPDAEVAEAGACTLPEAGPEGGACVPGPFDGGASAPTHVNPSACTPAQVQAFLDACIGPNQRTSLCQSFRDSTQSMACAQCIFSSPSDPVLGAMIELTFGSPVTGFSLANTGGCIEALDPCNAPCAGVAALAVQCQFAACDDGCTLGTIQSCVTAAETCPCAGYLQAVVDCGQKLAKANSPAAKCVQSLQQDFETQIKVAALAICSTGP